MGKPVDNLNPETHDDDSEENKVFAPPKESSKYDIDDLERKTISEESRKFSLADMYVGQHVDVLDSVQRWSEAQILKIDKENEKIFITYLYWENHWDEWIPEDAERIVPIHTHTYYTGGVLKKGQRIECKDEYGKWIESFVVDESPNKIKVHYKGFAAKFEEWVLRNDMSRIRPYGRNKDVTQIKRSQLLRQQQPHTGKMLSTTYKTTTNLSNQSDDEFRKRQIQAFTEKYNHYLDALSSNHLEIIRIPGDGNCLFRSISHQIYGDDCYHDVIRSKCMDYMETDAAFFSQFVEGGLDSFPRYLQIKRLPGCWGDDPEIQALCELYDRPAEIWAYDATLGARKLRTFHDAPARAGSIPMRLSYYGGGHYDSVVGADHAPNTLRSRPGVAEDAAIASLRERLRMSALSLSVPTTEPSREAVQEQEQAALDTAIKRSRLEMEGWGEEDLQTTLVLSLQDYPSYSRGMGGEMGGVTAGEGKDNSEDDDEGKSNEESKERRASSASGTRNQSTHAFAGDSKELSPVLDVLGLGAPTGVNFDPSLVAAQGHILRTVAEQSEREYLEKALEDSLAIATQSEVTEEELIRQAIQQSVSEHQDDENVALALELSRLELQEGKLSSDDVEMISSSYLGSTTSNSPVNQDYRNNVINTSTISNTNVFIPDEMDYETEMMNAALAASLASSSSAFGYDGGYVMVGGGGGNHGDDDLELNLAIEESLRQNRR